MYERAARKRKSWVSSERSISSSVGCERGMVSSSASAMIGLSVWVPGESCCLMKLVRLLI